MSGCEGFSLVSPEKIPPNPSLGNSCLVVALREQNRRKGHFLNFRKPLFGDPSLSLAPVSLFNLILLDNKYLLLGRKAMKNLGSILKKKRDHFADKGPSSQSYGFSSSHSLMKELDHKKG